MFDAELWDTGGLSRANFFSISLLVVYLSPGI